MPEGTIDARQVELLVNFKELAKQIKKRLDKPVTDRPLLSVEQQVSGDIAFIERMGNAQ